MIFLGSMFSSWGVNHVSNQQRSTHFWDSTSSSFFLETMCQERSWSSRPEGPTEPKHSIYPSTQDAITNIRMTFLGKFFGDPEHYRSVRDNGGVVPSFEYIECLLGPGCACWYEPSHTLQICIKRHIGNDDKYDDPGLMRSPGSKNVGNVSFKS